MPRIASIKGVEQDKQSICGNGGNQRRGMSNRHETRVRHRPISSMKGKQISPSPSDWKRIIGMWRCGELQAKRGKNEQILVSPFRANRYFFLFLFWNLRAFLARFR